MTPEGKSLMEAMRRRGCEVLRHILPAIDDYKMQQIEAIECPQARVAALYRHVTDMTAEPRGRVEGSLWRMGLLQAIALHVDNQQREKRGGQEAQQ